MNPTDLLLAASFAVFSAAVPMVAVAADTKEFDANLTLMRASGVAALIESCKKYDAVNAKAYDAWFANHSTNVELDFQKAGSDPKYPERVAEQLKGFDELAKSDLSSLVANCANILKEP